jgi:RNA polymerase sigma-70 factor (ECF subfamily)
VTTDEALYTRVREGNRAALAELVTRYHRQLYRFLYRMTNDEQMAENIVQDTFVRLITYEGEPPRRFKSWIYTVARNLAYDTFRSASYRCETSVEPEYGEWLPSHRPSVEVTVQHQVEWEAVVNVLQALKPHHREVLVLRFYHDLTLKEIADVIECPLGTVKSRLHYALSEAKFQLLRQEVVTHER